MPGGASLRRFFRVQFDNRHSAVGMFFPDQAHSEEASHDATDSARDWPFIELLELLSARGVSVPKLLGRDCAAGWILVEDLGDQTLASCLARHPERKVELYQTAVRDLATAQQALSELPSDCIVKQRKFDAGLLHWEMDHFREYGLEARGVRLNAEQHTRFDTCAKSIAETLAELDTGFVHRDYQSRNLMVHRSAAGERLVWVDFQDALLGPRVYDLVALLSDSYQAFDEAFIDDRLGEYVSHRGLPADTFAVVRREFDLVTVQRKLKDAGRFVFIERHKGDASYLKFIDPSLRKVRAAIRRLDGISAVRDLEHLLDELHVWPSDQ